MHDEVQKPFPVTGSTALQSQLPAVRSLTLADWEQA
jgi:hypothetical protein